MQGKLYGGSRYKGVPREMKKEMEKSPETARNLLTGRFGGSDRTLPRCVRLILERSKSPGIMTGRVRSQLTGRSQSPVEPVFFFFF